MKILAVEDEPEYLEMLKEFLAAFGHTLRVAENGSEALKVVDNENVDLVISDVNMPVMDGVEFHERFREKPGYSETPFVFLTGSGDVSEVKAVCRKKQDTLLLKPFPLDQLLKMFSSYAVHA